MTSQSTNTELVASLPLFATLTAEEQGRLAAMAERIDAAPGEILFTEGDPPGSVYVVVEGRLCLELELPGRGPTPLLTLGGGELLGWSSLLRRPRVATARIFKDATLLALPASELLMLCETDHRVGYAIMSAAFEELADRLVDTRLQMLDIFGKTGS